MSILRFACNPADVGFGAYTFNTTEHDFFDSTRTDGSFRLQNGQAIPLAHNAPASTEVWYHFRFGQKQNLEMRADGVLLEISDALSNTLASMNWANGYLNVTAHGDTEEATGTQALGTYTMYSMDIQVDVTSTVTVRWYINGALYGEKTVSNAVSGFGIPTNLTYIHPDGHSAYYAETIIADEDTRGMRIRELRPKALGIFQEWDGNVSALRDTDLATGMSTDTADRRVSFGVTNIENISPGDVINRVVSQTYAQKGETGLASFNHFFRYSDATTQDGANQTLTTNGEYFIEEFPTNPKTAVTWDAADFLSLQTGLRSRA